MYGLAAVFALVVATQADWPKIQKNFFNTEIAADMFPEVITSAVKNTALYTALSFVLGMVLALALALMHELIVHDWLDHDYIANHTLGWEQLRERALNC